jgi:DNA-binding response OmpR family regulator
MEWAEICGSFQKKTKAAFLRLNWKEFVMAKILVAEDNKHIREGLAQALSAEGHKVEQAQNGEIALTLYESFKPNIVILDIMMPKKSGFDVCNTLRKKGENVPIIFLTAKGEETDKLLGFNLGADDYLTKPFSLRELLARIGALLRRLNLPIEPDESFTIGSHVIDPKTFTITNARGKSENLKIRELKLLKYFHDHPNTVIMRDTLFAEVWNASKLMISRTIDQHIASIRKLLEEDSSCIETVIRVGYFYRV